MTNTIENKPAITMPETAQNAAVTVTETVNNADKKPATTAPKKRCKPADKPAEITAETIKNASTSLQEAEAKLTLAKSILRAAIREVNSAEGDDAKILAAAHLTEAEEKCAVAGENAERWRIYSASDPLAKYMNTMYAFYPKATKDKDGGLKEGEGKKRLRIKTFARETIMTWGKERTWVALCENLYAWLLSVNAATADGCKASECAERRGLDVGEFTFDKTSMSEKKTFAQKVVNALTGSEYNVCSKHVRYLEFKLSGNTNERGKIVFCDDVAFTEAIIDIVADLRGIRPIQFVSPKKK